MRPRGGHRRVAWSPVGRLSIGVLLVLAACAPGSASPSAPPSASAAQSAAPEPSLPLGEVIPAPGSDSRLFAPNPAAIVVALDPGHGGCLDWGVPNPYDNRVGRSEKALTLAIASRLRERLEADGVTVVMTRQGDVALAGDLYPDLGCTGAPFRDVNGDGYAGYGSLYPEATRTRDELSARIDLVNLARADVLLSIHVNSFSENGEVIQIAGTETFWTDETPWGVPHAERLALAVHAAVIERLAGVAPYERQDRGIEAVNFYLIAPPTSTGDPREPRRGILMPGVLAEVGSMSLAAEAELLATATGQEAIAAGLFDALAAFLAERRLGARIDLLQPGGVAGKVPPAVPGEGPMYWPPVVGDVGEVRIRITNTGVAPWPPDAQLLLGWGTTSEPYLARLTSLAPLESDLPALGPGESVNLEVALPPSPYDGRQVAWITVEADGIPLSDLGIPPLQVAVLP